jgi:pyruvate dehydrogenase E2 component (dihydrolipoamide acetyltransferase)
VTSAESSDGPIVPVTMPKWGLSMQLGKVTSWIVAEGDAVAVGDELADIETEKITGTLEASDAGTVRRIIARVGEEVPVSGTIALIAPAEVGEAELDAAVAQARAVIDAGVPADAEGGPEVLAAEVGGRKISYAGAGQDGDVVLLIHGFGGDKNSWLFLQEPLAARHRVYALDLPGHGASAKDVGNRVGGGDPAGAPAADPAGVLADAVAGVLDAVLVAAPGAAPGAVGDGGPDGAGGGRVHLVGHSMGGAVALAVAASDPARIASLTLIAPSGFGPEINVGYLRGFADAQTRRELRPVVGQIFADESLVTRQLVDDLLAYKRLDGVDEALHALLDMLLDGDAQRGDGQAALAAIGGAVPVSVVWGTEDRVIPSAQAQAVTGAVTYLVEGAGHMPHMERPGEVQAAIEQTIARSRLRLFMIAKGFTPGMGTKVFAIMFDQANVGWLRSPARWILC